MVRKRLQRFVQNDDKTPTAQENRVAERLGGKRVGGSGASMYSKGDVRDVTLSESGDNTDDGDGVGFLVECKKTEKKSISVKHAWLKKITYEAMAKEKEPMLTIEIQGDSDPNVDRDWAMIPMRVLRKLGGIE